VTGNSAKKSLEAAFGVVAGFESTFVCSPVIGNSIEWLEDGGDKLVVDIGGGRDEPEEVFE
jgi:hypothetical protein